MSMKKLLANLTTIFTVLLLNTFGLALHAPAMPMGSHNMSGMSHEKGSSASCTTLCETFVASKEEAVILASVDKDIDPISPYYSLFQGSILNDLDTTYKLYADTIKPPPKVPIYILYAVFRV